MTSDARKSAHAQAAPAPAQTAATSAVWTSVYQRLKRAARRKLAAEPSGHTLSTTALVHEVYLKLVGDRAAVVENRGQFLAHASRAMRRILVDHARRHLAIRRGGARVRVSLDPAEVSEDGSAIQLHLAAAERSDQLIALDEALDRLNELEPRLARVVECRFFTGLNEEETGEALGVTARTVRRDWVKARAWLLEALQEA
jgi:RNA polymerase sigma factor (TIGR02999 family)